MARGRNHHRNRNQQQIATQQQHPKPPAQQQPAADKQIVHQAQQQPQQIQCHLPPPPQPPPPMQSANASNAPVAAINKVPGSDSGNANGGNGAPSRPSPCRASPVSYVPNSHSNGNNCADEEDETIVQILHVRLDGPIKSHLETSGDPAAKVSKPRTNTVTAYQMTMSNNSHADLSQVRTDVGSPASELHDDEGGDDDQSNSADENREQQLPAAPSLQQREEPGRPSSCQSSNGADHERHYINRSPVIEQNVSVIAQVTGNNDHDANDSNSDDDDEKQCASPRITVHNGNADNVSYNGSPEYDRDCVLTNQPTTATTMGQKNTKADTSAAPPFRESSVPRAYDNTTGSKPPTRSPSPNVNVVPTITVVDCSAGAAATAGSAGAKTYGGSHTEKEEFYDFESPANKDGESSASKVEGQYGGNATQMASGPSSYRSPSPTSMYAQMRYNYMKLEDVPEQEEEEDEESDDDDDDAQDADEGNETDEGAGHRQNTQSAPSTAARTANLGNEFQHKHSPSLSPDRQHPSRSINISTSNSTDSNLSASFPDSGMGESVASATTSRFINTSDADCASASSAMHQMRQQQREHFPPAAFVRDGSSTDCDETLMHCEEVIDFGDASDGFLDPSERFVCIESISLPDVVVESTNSSGNSLNAQGGGASSGGSIGGDTSSSRSRHSSPAASGAERDIINICSGATSNSMGNVHFIPIHVEGAGSGRSSPRKQSVDDSVVGSGKATIEIIEDVTELQNSSNLIADKLKKELLAQKSQFGVQLEDAHKNVNNLQTKINEMQMKIANLEQELSAKTWNVERLQGELNAAQRDDEYVRKKLKLVEDEKTNLRHRYSECEDELKMKYDQLEIQNNELQEKYKQTQSLASNLQTQLAKAQSDAEESREEVEKIRIDLEEQIRLLKSALENSENERKICEDKWQREFEMLRTQNMEREESIMTDCEWQLRQMQRQSKDRVDKAEATRRDAEETVELMEEELEELRKEIDDLKVYQAQVNSLRGIVTEQANSIQTLMDQIDTLKKELSTANENLEEQIEAVKKIKFHCDNTLYDKERQMIYRIDEVRNEAAAFWEDKLYTEMTRLKHELESVYVDERRDELDKLQAEHVEELKALTNRYTYNEEELRAELSEVQERLDRKSEEFLELREKSDNALLQTRMHLDRADREFQKAMCQEEERREALEASLRQEFEEEKQEMENKFRQRLQHVKEEFAKELQINTQELKEQHQKDLEKVKAKLTAEKDEAIQELAERHRKKLQNMQEQMKEVEIRHNRDLKDLKAAYDAEKAALDKRDISNANEIEQLHRKCRCLTNLFEEMRMRYERRDPRPEDLREIAELRTRCESQERDMYLLTDRLREMQNQMNEMQLNGVNVKKTKQIKKPPPKTIPTNCDVIYEENEDRDSPPPADDQGYDTGDNKEKPKKLVTNNQDDMHMITAM